MSTSQESSSKKQGSPAGSGIAAVRHTHAEEAQREAAEARQKRETQKKLAMEKEAEAAKTAKKAVREAAELKAKQDAEKQLTMEKEVEAAKAAKEAEREAAELKPKQKKEASNEPSNSNGSFSSEAVQLREALQALRQVVRPGLDSADPVPFDPTVVNELRSILAECQSLQRYTEEGIGRISQEVQVKTLSGEVFSVTVNPETDTVLTLKQKVAELRGVNAYETKLIPGGLEAKQAEALKAHDADRQAYEDAKDAYQKAREIFEKAREQYDNSSRSLADAMAGDMKNDVPLSSYDLTSEINLVVTSVEIGNQLLRLKFDNTEDLSFDSVSQKSGSWLYPEQKVAIENDGRCGIDFQGHSVLKIGEPIVLPEAWTISVWTLAPIDPKGYRNLVDDTGDNRIVIAITNRQIGDYNLNRYAQYDPGVLPAGWHHIAAVGANGSVSYYVDGELVGSHTGQSQGRISSVGNRGDGMCSESWGIMSDLRIFGCAASKTEIEALARST